MGCVVVRARCESLLLKALHGVGDGRRNNVTDHIEVRTRFVVTEERLQLNARLLSAGDSVRFVGLELSKLQVESFVVELGEVAGFEALVAYVELVFEISKVVISQFLRGLGNHEAGKGLANSKDGLLLLGVILGVGLSCGGAGAVKAPAALFTSFE